jgi:hypothetical protein
LLAALLTTLDEVEVLNDDGSTAVRFRYADEFGDRGTQSSISRRRGEPRELDGHAERCPDRVSRGVDDTGRQVTVIEVDRQDPMRLQLVEALSLAVIESPQRVAVPTLLLRVERDVVAHGTGVSLRGDLVSAVRKGDRTRKAVTATRSVGVVFERVGQTNFEPLLFRVPTDGEVSE